MPKKPSYSISERKFFLRLIDLVVVVGTIFLASNFLDFHYFDALDSYLFTWLSTLCIYIIFFGQIFELYNLKVASSRYLVLRSIGITAFLTTVFYIFTPIVAPILPGNRLQILYLFGTIFLPILIWRFIYIGFVFLPKYHKYLLLIGKSDDLLDLIHLIERKAPDNRIVGYISEKVIPNINEDYKRFVATDEFIKDIVEYHYISEVVVSKGDLSESKKIYNQLIYLFENGVPIVSAKKFVEKITYLVPELELSDSFYDYLTISQSQQSKLYLAFTRLFDIITALIGVLFLTLMLPIILLGNLIANRGKLFYFQERVGQKGKTFTMIKLRTMVKDAEKDGAVWASKDDYRVTLFGKFLRSARLDEVPQFLNILRGDMSLIGPRPERPEFVIDLEKQIPFYAIRHVVKPGLTGWAQVMHPYANTIEDYNLKVRYDLYYIKERSLLMDFRIVIKTITTVLFFRGH